MRAMRWRVWRLRLKRVRPFDLLPVCWQMPEDKQALRLGAASYPYPPKQLINDIESIAVWPPACVPNRHEENDIASGIAGGRGAGRRRIPDSDAPFGSHRIRALHGFAAPTRSVHRNGADPRDDRRVAA